MLSCFYVDVQAGLGECRTVFCKAKVGEDTKPQLVRVRHIFIIHATQLGLNNFLLLLCQWFPEVFVRDGKRVPDGACFYHPLTHIFHQAPTPWTLWVCPSYQAIHKPFSSCILASTSE